MLSKSFVLLFMCLCTPKRILSLPDHHEIYVDPKNQDSVDNSTCYTLGRKLPCADFNFALAFPGRTRSTTFFLSSAVTHYLRNDSNTTVLNGASSVAFHGDNGTAVVECMDGAGLAFLNSTNIAFNGVSFQKCGAWRDSTSRDFSSNSFQLMRIRVGLYFYNCRDVTMVNMSVLNSTEAVGVVMYSTAGVNNISRSQFDSNRISESNKNESGGGGFAVEFNYCKPGDNSCNETNHQTENNKNAIYIFEHCSFSNNRAVDQSGHDQKGFSILPHNETHSALGGGGGFTLYFKGNATNITITLRDCTFHHNHATWGAGMFVVFADSSIQNFVNVSHGSFSDNHCYHTESNRSSSGGGVYAESVVYYTEWLDKMYQKNSVVVKHCVFSSNIAILGGAVSLAYHHQPFSHKHQLFQVNVSRCSFFHNSARLGSAVSINNDHHFTLGELGTVFFDTCYFFHNTIAYVNTTRPYSVGVGAVYISEVSVTFLGYMYFFRNNGTALAIAGTSVVFSTNASVTFSYNHGSSGGAIALLGAATLVVGKNTRFIFKKNSATLYGGAIYNNYIGKEDLRSSVKCFLQYTDPFEMQEKWKASFQFIGNKAGKLGQSIFSSTILPCLWLDGYRTDVEAVSKVFCWNDSTWVYENSSCSEEINTYPLVFDFTNASHVIFPGHKFQLNIQALDDLNHDVSNETVYTAVSNTSSFEVDPGYTYISGGDVVVTGLKEQHLTLELNTANTRDWHLQLHLTMERCPPGFKASEEDDASKRVCSCLGGESLYSFSGNLLCDRENLVSKIRNGHWIGYVPAVGNSTLFVGATSLLYNYTSEDFYPIAKTFEELDRDQCRPFHRTGPLCGECIEGYSTAVNSYNYECVPCTSNTTNLAANIAAYIGLTYLPYLMVFIAIIYFDVRLMSGPLVGFILYAQLIGSGVVDLTENSISYNIVGDFLPKMQRAYKIAYGVFNLNSLSELMDPFCVHENFSALDVICLDYAVAVFPLLLILVIHFLSPLKSLRLRRKLRGIRDTTKALQRSRDGKGRSLIHPFAGFIYLSYTKFALTSTKLLSTTSPITKDGSNPSGIRLVYYAGQYYFGQKEYILPYGLIAIAMFIVFAVFLPFLLLGPLDFMNWLTDKPRFSFLNKYWPSVRINIYLDAFRGCYHSNRRFFTGIYFVFRLVAFVIFAFSPNELINRVWQLAFLIVLIILVAKYSPYQVAFLNNLDILIFFTASVTHLISIYLDIKQISNVHNGYPFQVYTFGLIVIWLPMLYFLLYMCWLVVHNHWIYRYTSDRLQPLTNCLSKLFGSSGTEEERRPLLNPARGRMRIEINDDGLSDASLFERAEETSRYRPPPRKVTVTVASAGGHPGTTEECGTGSSGIATGESNGSNIESSIPSNIQVTSTGTYNHCD